jgi:hypothetical protein
MKPDEIQELRSMNRCEKCGEHSENRGGDALRLHEGKWLCADCIIGILESELSRLRTAITTTEHAIEQTLGRALGYPPLYPDVSSVDDGQVCVGDHISETLATEAAERIRSLTGIVDDLRRLACDGCSSNAPRDEHGNHPAWYGLCDAWTDTEEEAANAARGEGGGMSMRMCKCGSYAINDDPRGRQCDRCWRTDVIERLTDELLRLQKVVCDEDCESIERVLNGEKKRRARG